MSRAILALAFALIGCVAQKTVRGMPVADPKTADTVTGADSGAKGATIGIGSDPPGTDGICHDEADRQHPCPDRVPQPAEEHR